MRHREIKNHRLSNQQIAIHNFKTPGEVVRWLGAVQAQDYLGSLWAIGLRLDRTTEKEIEKAIANKAIVRTWPMRGTLHFVTPQDIRWMLKLLTPRVIARSAGAYRQAGLDTKIFSKSRKIFINALEGGKTLTRNEMYALLDRVKINTDGQRGLHILAQLAQEGLLCFASRKGKQQTFALLDEWISAGKVLERDEALAELASRYFKSHGPATIADFGWWSGLTKAEANEAFELVKSEFICEAIENRDFLVYAEAKHTIGSKSATYLLPTYDEYLVSYKDRNAAFDPRQEKTDQNMIFSPIVVVDGFVRGTWRRTLENKKALVEIDPVQIRSKNIFAQKAIKRYSHFLDLPVELV